MITEKLWNFGKFPGTKITSGTIEQHGTENQAFSETQCFSHFCVFGSFAENAATLSYYYIFGPNLHWNITKQPYIEKMTITEMKIYIWVRSRRNSVSPNVPKVSPNVPIETLPPKLRVRNFHLNGGCIKIWRVASFDSGVKIMRRDGIRAVTLFWQL